MTAPAARRVLPLRRACASSDLYHDNQTYTISVGFFDEGTPAELFLGGSKVGSGVEAIARDAAILVSLGLQYGVPLETMRGAITRDKGGNAASVIGAAIDFLSNRQQQQEKSNSKGSEE